MIYALSFVVLLLVVVTVLHIGAVRDLKNDISLLRLILENHKSRDDSFEESLKVTDRSLSAHKTKYSMHVTENKDENRLLNERVGMIQHKVEELLK